VVLTADSILARGTRRRQTSTGWNTAYIGANRYTLPQCWRRLRVALSTSRSAGIPPPRAGLNPAHYRCN
jgi:hypothetical protein